MITQSIGMHLIRHVFLSLVLTLTLLAQVSSPGFLNLPRNEAPGTLLSHPDDNDSEAMGRTTTLNCLYGWLIIGAEAPGSRIGSDLEMRVYDVSDLSNPIRRRPSDFCRAFPNNRWFQGNLGWNAHDTAQLGTFSIPGIIVGTQG